MTKKKIPNHLESKSKEKNVSKNNNRFYTSLDMSIVKKDAAAKNSQIKRGETEDKGNHYISVCGCGVEGCFIHSSYESISQEERNKLHENQRLHHAEFLYNDKLKIKDLYKKELVTLYEASHGMSGIPAEDIDKTYSFRGLDGSNIRAIAIKGSFFGIISLNKDRFKKV